MKNLRIISVIIILFYTHIIQAKALRSQPQTGDSFIISKGDIPTPNKYHSVIDYYMKYTKEKISQSIINLKKLQCEVKQGNITQAKKLYILAHNNYVMIRPIVMLFGDSDRILDPRESYFIQGRNDWRFKGFHLIEYLLFKTNNKDQALSATDDLIYNLTDIKERLSIETIEITKLIQSSGDFIETAIEVNLAGKENIYSNSDLNDLHANIESSYKILTLLKPFIPKDNYKILDDNNMRITSVLNEYKNNNIYLPFKHLTINDKNKLYSLLSTQADLLATIRSLLKINVYHKFEVENNEK
ncbi:EfeM/EfeO family lipoprotein [Photobacterium damselae]|uniref:EfeM/EfeO family lipoprotein n=1 Tax=Photobacterium damselae TaxID=38293 RepID=UPI001EE038A7|nr:EfeM/EfeO family lipoprotein [Photobacterium damselae]MCG3845876.1 EfeM/EfeO family lipoprotein [Photobacterium damselae]